MVVGGFVLNSEGDLAEIRCLGPGAWHPLDPSWVPLPVPGAGKIFWGHGVRGLASPDPFLGAGVWCVSTTDYGGVEVIQQCLLLRD